jgi:hypothetical protein
LRVSLGGQKLTHSLPVRGIFEAAIAGWSDKLATTIAPNIDHDFPIDMPPVLFRNDHDKRCERCHRALEQRQRDGDEDPRMFDAASHF